MFWIAVAFWFGGVVVSLLRDGFKVSEPSDYIVHLGKSAFAPDPSDSDAAASFNTAYASTQYLIHKFRPVFNIGSALLWPISEAITAIVIPRMNRAARLRHEAICKAGRPKLCDPCKESFECGMRAHEEWHEMNRACRDCQNLLKR